MKIEELSKAAKVSARSVRHYEPNGLIASRRMRNEYRQFGPSARTNRIQPKTSVKDRRVLSRPFWWVFHPLTAILANPCQVKVVTAKRVDVPPQQRDGQAPSWPATTTA
jgi:hypothetical protein